jgi:hypothetical protein
MWIPASLEIRPTSFSFASSELGIHHDRSLRADGTTLVNMLGLAEWSDDPVQVEICEHCGIPECASGGYVAVRRLGAFVTFAPSKRAYPASLGGAGNDLQEPRYIRKQGLPLIPAQEWDRLRADAPGVPACQAIAPMTWSEAFLAAQLEAPYRLLGEPGESVHRLSELVAATDPWLDPADLDRLGDGTAWRGSQDAVVSVQRGEAVQPYSVLLTDPSREVRLFGSANDAFGLYFAPGLLLVPESA